MLVKMETGASGGGGQIPFTLVPYSGRLTFTSQNCYIFDDNGTPTIHYEFTASAPVSTSNGSLAKGVVPYHTKSEVSPTGVFPNNWTISIITGSGVDGLYFIGSTTAGNTYTMNQDLACDWLT